MSIKVSIFFDLNGHHVSICEQEYRNTKINSNDLNDANENAENNAENDVILLQATETLISSKNNNH